MSSDAPLPPLRAAGVVLPCGELEPTMTFFTDLGFELVSIGPAEQPTRATLAGFGLRLHLDPDTRGDPGVLRLLCDHATTDGHESRVAPNGTRIEIISDSAAVPVPDAQPRFGVSRGRDATWTTGRAGMRYRDLVPDRAGGALIASLIHIADAGPVPDYVHYHRVAFQLIYCAAGWVEVAYEDQGPPFVLEQGDAVLQPPGIRHEVRESSDELVVIEVTVPADHDTTADTEIDLPNDAFRPSRRFGGQRFIRHVATRAIWVPWNGSSDFEGQRLRIDVPTNHLAAAWTIRTADGGTTTVPGSTSTALVVVLDGALDVTVDGHTTTRLDVADAVVVPPNCDYDLVVDDQVELLWVALRLPVDEQSEPTPSGQSS